MQVAPLAILLFSALVVGLAVALLLFGRLFVHPSRVGPVKEMPYESGMDPIHDTRRRFDVRFHILAIAFLVFDVELLFLYPWAVALRDRAADGASVAEARGGSTPLVALPEASGTPAGAEAGRPAVRPLFVGGMVFLAVLTLGFVYDWRKGVFRWR